MLDVPDKRVSYPSDTVSEGSRQANSNVPLVTANKVLKQPRTQGSKSVKPQKKRPSFHSSVSGVLKNKTSSSGASNALRKCTRRSPLNAQAVKRKLATNKRNIETAYARVRATASAQTARASARNWQNTNCRSNFEGSLLGCSDAKQLRNTIHNSTRSVGWCIPKNIFVHVSREKADKDSP